MHALCNEYLKSKQNIQTICTFTKSLQNEKKLTLDTADIREVRRLLSKILTIKEFTRYIFFNSSVKFS